MNIMGIIDIDSQPKEKRINIFSIGLGLILYFYALYNGKTNPFFLYAFFGGLLLLVIPVFLLKDDSLLSLEYCGGILSKCSKCKKYIRPENSECLDSNTYCKKCFEDLRKQIK